MTKRLAFLFPGQGAQMPGMGRDFFENYPEAKELFEEADELLGKNFSRLIFEGSKDELTETKNSQPAIFVTSLAILQTLKKQLPDLTPQVCAGLSLGEYPALVASGKLSFAEALKIVAKRGELMDDACIRYPGTMRVVLGMSEEQVKEAIDGIRGVWIANLNCPGQVVISGEVKAIEEASKRLSAAGAKRVLPLEVAGAFHSGLMEEAQQKLAPLIEGADLQSSDIAVVMNVPGDFVEDLKQMRFFMIEQITHSVRWERGIRKIDEKGIDLYLEIGPGKTLSGMNRKIGVSAPTLNIETCADLDLFAEKWEELCSC